MIQELRAGLMALSVFRPLLDEPLMGRLRSLLDHLAGGKGEAALEDYAQIFYLLQAEGYDGPGGWLWGRLR